MLTPIDVKNKEFKRSFRGYDIDDVEDFLELLYEDYEKLYKENGSLKDKLEVVNDKIQHYAKIESTIQNTLILAQNAADQAKKTAQKEADLIIKNANDSAQRILDKAHNDVVKINDDYDRIKQEFAKFTSKFRNFMNSQLEMFQSLEKDFVKNYNIGKPVDQMVEKDIEYGNDLDNTKINEDKNDFKAKDIEKESFAEDNLNEIKSFFANEE
ncbi:DivIVA domain-containing protein [Haloimpatiens sp. FM7330]|uniref:DivIVA domain-containing protein n=1 Tax=Haloimpatiens sp. FM7330 TaxID=3298610 RepID=UPI0036448099